MVGRQRRLAKSPQIKKSRARLASPQPRPTSPVNGAGGMTGCRDYAQSPRTRSRRRKIFLRTRLSDRRIREPAGSGSRCVLRSPWGEGTTDMSQIIQRNFRRDSAVSLDALARCAWGRDPRSGSGRSASRARSPTGSQHQPRRQGRSRARRGPVGGADPDDFASAAWSCPIPRSWSAFPLADERRHCHRRLAAVKPAASQKPLVACEPVVSVLTEVPSSLSRAAA